MENLIKFFEKKLNKKINILEYESDSSPISKLNPNQNIVLFNDKEYIIEIKDTFTLNNLNGHFYLIYQKNIEFDSLSNILTNLYEDINIIEYNDFLIINSQAHVDIDASTSQILEIETYKSTHIVDLGNINDLELFKFRISIFENLLTYINLGYSINKFIKVQDLIIHHITTLINENKTLFNFIDYNQVKSIDDTLIHTGLAFIEHDLNISKTSSALFLHRNTLIYRLDKIKELLHLDLKFFKDAQIFYLVMKSYEFSSFNI